MALIAQLDGERVDASIMSAEEWSHLKDSDERRRLTMPLCGLKAVAKNLGATQFFSHYRVTNCEVDHGGESPQHHAMKEAIAYAVGQLPGWSCEIEHPHPSRKWIIDVMAQSEDGRKRYAFEVQLSNQAPEEYQRRSQQYFDSGYMPIWLVPRAPESNTIKIPTLVTGFGKSSDTPERPQNLLQLPAVPSGLELQARSLGDALEELLRQGHRWRHGSPRQQAETLKAIRDKAELERREKEESQAQFQAMVDNMNRRTAPASAAFGEQIVKTEDNIHVRAAVTECWQRRCQHPMLIWHAWTPRRYWKQAYGPPDVPAEVGLKRFENHPAVHRVVDRWMTVVDCDVEKAIIDLRRTKAKRRTYRAFVCPACDSVCGQIFISILGVGKWSMIGSPQGAE